MKKVGKGSRELRSMGVHQGLSSVLDVSRDARWGRLEETFGEDPYLIGDGDRLYQRSARGKPSTVGHAQALYRHSGSEVEETMPLAFE